MEKKYDAINVLASTKEKYRDIMSYYKIYNWAKLMDTIADRLLSKIQEDKKRFYEKK